MNPQLLSYYEAIEHASAAMLAAARRGNWDEVVRLEGICNLLISELKHAARAPKAADPETVVTPAHTDDPKSLEVDEALRVKSRIIERILRNDAEIRALAEPLIAILYAAPEGDRRTLH